MSPFIAPGGPPNASGRYIVSQGTMATMTPILNRRYAVPAMVMPEEMIIRVGVGVTVAAAAGGVLRWGLMQSGPNGLPLNILIEAETLQNATLVGDSVAQMVALSWKVRRKYESNRPSLWVTMKAEVAAPTIRSLNTVAAVSFPLPTTAFPTGLVAGIFVDEAAGAFVDRSESDWLYAAGVPVPAHVLEVS